MKKIIYKIWLYFHRAIDHKIMADGYHRGGGQFSDGISGSGYWNVPCEKCGQRVKEIYEEFYK